MILGQLPFTASVAVVASVLLRFLNLKPLRMGKVVAWCTRFLGTPAASFHLILFRMRQPIGFACGTSLLKMGGVPATAIRTSLRPMSQASQAAVVQYLLRMGLALGLAIGAVLFRMGQSIGTCLCTGFFWMCQAIGTFPCSRVGKSFGTVSQKIGTMIGTSNFRVFMRHTHLQPGEGAGLQWVGTRLARDGQSRPSQVQYRLCRNYTLTWDC